MSGAGAGPSARAVSGSAFFVRRFARAKVNLTLQVVGRRPDGYHELDSLVVFAEFGDSLSLQPDKGLRLELRGRFAASLRRQPGARPPPNLVRAAAERLRARHGVDAGARMRLVKRIPVAAGLGGGTADAAAVLSGLAELWGLSARPADLARIGAELGADVPVCVVGRPSYLAGIGERIEPAPALPPAWLVLVNPGVALPTGQVFAARSGAFSTARRLAGTPRDASELAARLKGIGNDLEPAALRLVPAIGEVLMRLEAAPGCLLARMSGSGASCFGLFARAREARTAARAVAAGRPNWWSVAARMAE